MKKFIVLTFLICISLISFSISGFSQSGTSEEKRDILQKKSAEIGLELNLIQDFSDIGFPAYGDRDYWMTISASLRKQYIEEAEEAIEYNWPAVKATDYLEFIRSGDRRQGVFYEPRSALVALVMGELMEGEGRFVDQIVNGVWYYSEQTWWGWSAHLPQPMGLPDIHNPYIDLGVGEIVNILSWTWHLFHEEFDEIHPFISQRLKDEIMQKAIIPYYERDDFWWMGFNRVRRVNNWNPWTNHNMLTAILIMEDDQEKKTAGVQKVISSLDFFLNLYPADGGCDEGPSYWGRAAASLYQNLDLLNLATKGQFNVYDEPLIKNMGTFIYKAYISYPYFLNFADADATTGSRPQIIYSYGKDIQDPVMQNFGAFLAKKQDWGRKTPGGKIDEQFMQLLLLDEIAKAPAEEALIGDFFLPDIEVAGARDQEGSEKGFYFAAKGGHNAESHNHNDLGTCVLYYDGKPCLIDIGRENYVARTFSSRRYEIWTMQSQYHNLPRINGIDQKEGRQYEALSTSFSADARKAVFSTDISQAYTEEAGVEKWVRSYRLDRGEKFTISDQYTLGKTASDPSTLNFVTACEVSEIKSGVLDLAGEGFSLEMKYDPKNVSVELEFVEVTDSTLKRYWPKGITRIVFTLQPGLTGKNQIVLTKGK